MERLSKLKSPAIRSYGFGTLCSSLRAVAHERVREYYDLRTMDVGNEGDTRPVLDRIVGHTMIYPRCSHENPEDAHFCGDCDRTLVRGDRGSHASSVVERRLNLARRDLTERPGRACVGKMKSAVLLSAVNGHAARGREV